MPTVDSLDIEISASVSKANASLDLLVKRLGKVSASLSGVNTRGIATMAGGVNKLANAMNNFSNNTNTAVFTRLTRNLNSLGNIDQNAIANASKSLGKIAGAMRVLNNVNVSDNARQLGDLARGISQLGYKSSTQAIQNIPQLATAMRNLMQTLSTAPRVNQNLIDMTNALARLARTGASSGRAANSLGKSLNIFGNSTIGARKKTLSLASAIGKLYASYWLLIRAFGGIGKTIDVASGLQEVQNVVDVTFGDFKKKVEDLADVSITEFGISELTAKQTAGRFQAMGTAMGIAQGKMSDMSVELTKLSADMASFYNVAQSDVARSLQSVFTGEAEPMRKYGVDLTQATLKTFALSQGLDSNVEAMTQAEKTMLRYQYVMHATGAAQGDFARTSNNWANQIRVLKGNFEELAGIIGTSFINALKPLVKALNSAMRAIINFAKIVSNSLGKIFGWQYEETGGGVTSDMEDASGYADDLADSTGKAANNAKKLKQQLQGIDELNVITSPSDTGSGGSGGAGGGTGTEDANAGGWTKTDSILKDYESQLDTLYKLGEEIGNRLTKAMNSIDWNSVYQGARNFGSGLASFLNGLISPELFGAVGKTIASSLNTVIYSALSFGEDFDFKEFGESIATAINDFFGTFDFESLAKTINTWVHGLEDALVKAISTLDVKKIMGGITEFLTNIDLDVVALSIGAILWKYKGAELAMSGLGALLSKEIATGIGGLTTTVGMTLGVSITTAIVGFKIGNKLYEEVPTVQNIADGVAEWILKDGEEIAIAKTISVSLTGLAIALSTAGIVTAIQTAITGAIVAASAEASLAGTGIGAVILGKIGVAISNAGAALSSLGTTISTAIAGSIGTIAPIAAKVGIVVVAAIVGFKIGNKLYEEVPTVQNIADGVAEWILKDGEEIAIAKTISVSLTGLAIALSTAGIVTAIQTAITGAIVAASAEASLAGTGIGAVILGKIGVAISNAGAALSSLGTTISTAIAGSIGTIAPIAAKVGIVVVAAIVGFKIGETLYENSKTVQKSSDALVELIAGFFDGSYNLNDYVQGGIAMGVDLSVKLMNLFLPDGSKIDANQALDNWLPKYIAQYFLGDDVDKQNTINYFANFTANLKGNAKKNIENIKKKWSQLKKENKTLKFVTKITDSVQSKLDKIKKIWDDLKFNKSISLTARFNDAFTGAIKSAWNRIANVLNAGLNKMNEWLPSNLKFSGRIPTFATGGFPEDGWFRASHGEVMGKFDNGQSVVANNMQITEGIASAVHRGNQQMIAYLQQEVNELRQQNEYLQTIASKEFGITETQIGKASQKFARDYSNRTGRPAYI